MSRIVVQQLEPPYKFVSPFLTKEFVVWVIAADKQLSPEKQMEISTALVSSGCRYMCASGIECSSWDDSVDYAFMDLENEAAEVLPFVMTTWHEDEDIENTAEFFSLNTFFEDFVPENFLILGIGEQSCPFLERAEKAVRKLIGQSS